MSIDAKMIQSFCNCYQGDHPAANSPEVEIYRVVDAESINPTQPYPCY